MRKSQLTGQAKHNSVPPNEVGQSDREQKTPQEKGPLRALFNLAQGVLIPATGG